MKHLRIQSLLIIIMLSLGLYLLYTRYYRILSPVVTKEALFEAAAADNVTEIKRLVKAGVNVNAQDDKGNTALSIAASRHNLQAVLAILRAMAFPDEKFLAQARANPEIMEVLKHYMQEIKKEAEDVRKLVDEARLKGEVFNAAELKDWFERFQSALKENTALTWNVNK